MSDVSWQIPHAVTDSRPRNLHIQWLRALAAFMVVLFHASAYGVAVMKDDTFLKILDGRLGISGVSLFFVISGYLMATAVKVQEPFIFLSHRVIRIYPTFFIVAFLYCTAEYALHQPVRINFAALTLAPVGSMAKYPLRVEWTLVFEVTFYIALFFIALCGWARRVPWIAGAWLVVLAGFSWLRPDAGDLMYPIQRILTVCETVGMAGGLLIPTLLRLRLPPVLLLLVGAAAWPIYSYHPFANDGARWLFGIGATLVVAGMIGVSQKWPLLGQNKIGRSCATFGDYSYALYLIHGPIIYSVYSLGRGLYYPVLWAIALAITLPSAIVLGWMDVRLYQRLKSSLKNLSKSRLRIAIWAYLVVLLAFAMPNGIKVHALEAKMETSHKLANLVENRIVTQDTFTQIQVRQAAIDAGFTESPVLQGEVEKAWVDDGNFEIDGWAIDPRNPKKVTMIALLQNGKLLDAGMTSFTRADITGRFGVRAKTGFAVTLATACFAGGPIIGLVLTRDHSFAVMQGTIVPDCAPK